MKPFSELSRLQQSIMLILYKYYPIPMSEGEILEAIAYEGLLFMTDEEFKKCHRELVEKRQYEEKARLN
jgi:hypothetical protein